MNAYALVGIVAVIVITVAAIGLKLYGRSQRKLGGSQVRSKGLEASVDAAKKGQEIDEDVDSMSDAAVLDELRTNRHK